MSLKSSNKVDTNVWELEVSVDGDTFKDAVTKAYLKQRKNITIPGFRKGKAPRAFIEKYYGEGVFYEDALEAIYPDAVASAIEDAKLEPVDTPYDLEIPEMGKDGVTMKFKVTVKPEIELGEYKGLKATKKSTKVSADEVKAELARMQEQNSTISDVDDRAVKKNDIVVIDFEGFVDGKAFEGGKAEKYELTIGSNQFIPGFEDQIIGHKIGDEFDINVKFPDDYQADLASKDAVFKIKLHGIKVKEVPALDDEFAKDVSEFDTLDELKKDIKKQLEKRKNDDAENELHNALLEEVAKGVKAEIPEAMIEKTIDDDVNEYSYRLRSQGLKLETYLKYTGMDMKGFREGFKERAETQVRLNLALEKIIEKEKIEVTEEDIEAEYKKYADAYNMDIDTIKKAVSAESLKPELASRKAIDLIVDSAVVTEEKAAKKTAEKKPAAKKTTTKKPAAKKTAEKAADKKSADKAE
ncbi:MAG: trigger factor [Ruminococcus sp.]|nr:trigger factor [Ruminococcus sp.]MDY3895533.1 trigger factor [Candidatus Fimenecus sp.]